MKYIKYFSNVSSANEAGQNGMFSPHVDTISGLSTVNMVRVSTSTFTCSYNGVGVVTDVVPVTPVDPEGGKKLFYTTTDGQITNPNPSTSTVSNWFEPAVLVSNTYGSVGVMQFDRSLTTIVDGYRNESEIDLGLFASNTNIATVSNSNISYVGTFAFAQCKALVSASFPACISIGDKVFDKCLTLQSISLPNCISVGEGAFRGCYVLCSISLPMCTTIGSGAFSRCTSLQTITLGASTVCTLSVSNTFYLTPIASGTGSIYVPASLVSAYQSASNWSYFSSRIFAIPE